MRLAPAIADCICRRMKVLVGNWLPALLSQSVFVLFYGVVRSQCRVCCVTVVAELFRSLAGTIATCCIEWVDAPEQ